MAEINLRGDDFHLTLDVNRYERQRRGQDSYDDNWLSGAVTVTVAQPRHASFKAKCEVAWQTTDLVRFQENLRTLLDDLSGVATFSTIEDQIELTMGNFLSVDEQRKHPHRARQRYVADRGDTTPPIAVITGQALPPAT